MEVSTGPAPKDASKALVYVFRPRHYGTKVDIMFEIDGVELGVMYPFRYLFFEVEPGQRQLKMRGKKTLGISASIETSHYVEAGKTYYCWHALEGKDSKIAFVDEETGLKFRSAAQGPGGTPGGKGYIEADGLPDGEGGPPSGCVLV
jgi:hypothetical protein